MFSDQKLGVHFRLGSLMPAWMEHMQRHLVFDGDHALLHIQEQIAAREAQQPGGSWRKSYWMPTESDRWLLSNLGLRLIPSSLAG